MTFVFEPDPVPNEPVEAQCGNPEPHEGHVWQRGVAAHYAGGTVQDWSPIYRCLGVGDETTTGVDT